MRDGDMYAKASNLDLLEEVEKLRAENAKLTGWVNAAATDIGELKALLRSAYGYVKAHEFEGLTKDLLARISEALGEGK